MARSLRFRFQDWPLKTPFRIARGNVDAYRCLIVEIGQQGDTGRGEARGIYYLGETDASLTEQVNIARASVEDGCSREDLATVLPPGAARNALDCALWDLECRLENSSIWDRLGVPARPLETFITLGMTDRAEDLVTAALAAQPYQRLKVKLGAKDPIAMVKAVRDARPDAMLVVDANQSLKADGLADVMEAFVGLDVAVLEQPLAADADDCLGQIDTPLMLCADESCQSLGDLDRLPAAYGMINIKLDKAGGLTHALAMVERARQKGLQIMVGNMLGTSLAMAPALMLAQLCDLADLDGAALLSQDYPGGVRYEGGKIHPPSPGFWGVSLP